MSFGICFNELNSKSYLLNGGTAIPGNADMNDYATPGNYYCANSSIAASLTNCPFTSAFVLKVEYSTGVRYQRQIFTAFRTAQKAIRYFDPETNKWQPYVYFSDDATMQTSMESYMFTTSGEYSADCNDITQPGLCKRIVTPGAENSPGFYAYILVLRYKSYSDENLTQVAFPYTSSDPIKTRYRYSGAWSEWI